MSAPSRPPRRGRRAFVTLAVALLVAVGAAWAWRAAGAAELKAQIDRVRLAGDVLVPADLPAPPSTGKDPAVWLSRTALVRVRWDLPALSDPARYTPLLERARARELGDDARVAFEEFEAALRPLVNESADPGGTWNSFWAVFAARLAECNGVPDWDAPSRAALRLLALGLDPARALARAVDGVGSIDPRHVARVMDESNAAVPRLPLIEQGILADAVNVASVSAAVDGRAGEALDGVRLGLDLSRVHAPPAFLLAHTIRVHHVSRALDTLQMILPRLPRGLDVSDLEAQLAAIAPRAELARALSAERAFGNRVFESLRAGFAPVDVPELADGSGFAAWRRAFVRDRDQACYLRALTDGIEFVGRRVSARGALPERPAPSALHPIASRLAPDLAPVLRLDDLVEARLALGRIALTAYRAGAQEALRALASSVDPFDGKPVRCSLGTEGLIVLWSVGVDGRDDEGRADSDDLVWGLRLTE